MPQKIPQPFIDDLLSRVDIIDIIGSRIKLRRTGSNSVGLCPFHSEKTPSFVVSQSKQIFNCFGCHAHGNAISFLMQYERLGFIDALEALATQVGMTLPQSTQYENSVNFTEFFALTERIATFYKQQLPRSTRTINYLKARGLSGEICKQFGIGYAPPDWENLTSVINANPTIKNQLLEIGLLIQKDKKVYSRFRDRVMFPIRNQRGSIVGFGGRALSKDDLAKYLNSPESPIFHKGNELYGLYEAKKGNPRLNKIIVVEGYMDVVALAQYGITNVAATSGTAVTTKQVHQLLRYSSDIIFCFDGDTAGRGAAWRALENILPLMRDGISASFLFLPETEDPDSLIRKEGKNAFLKRAETALTLSDFFFKHLTANQMDISTMDGRARLANNAKNILGKMPNSVFKQLLLNKLAELIHIDIDELEQGNNKTQLFTNDNAAQQPTNSELHPLVKRALSLLLHHPQLNDHIENIENLSIIDVPGIGLLIEILKLLKKHPNLTTGAILEYWRNHQNMEELSRLATKEHLISASGLKNEFLGTINKLLELNNEQVIQSYLSKAVGAGLSIEEKQKLQQLIISTKSKRNSSESDL